MEFKIQLVEEKVKQQQVTSLHLISALAFLGAGAIIFLYNSTITYWGLALLVVAIGILAMVMGRNRWVTRPANNTAFRVVELVIAASLAGYSAMQDWKLPLGIFGVIAAALVFSLYWERKSNAAQYVFVDDNGIALPGVRAKDMQWTGVEKVMLRFGTLSISTTDNHMLQWNVHPVTFDAAAFEQYCTQKIDANRENRRKDDW